MCSLPENPPAAAMPTQPPASAARPIPLAPAEKHRCLARRRRKTALLPQIRELALEGHSCREIAASLELTKTTVARWLQELRTEGRSKIDDSGEMIAHSVARYDAIYREAMEAWRGSKAGREVRFVEETAATGEGGGEGGGSSKHKRSIRTDRRTGDVAFLAAARQAVDAISKLAPWRPAPTRMEELLAKDLDRMSSDEIDEFNERLAEENERREDELMEIEEMLERSGESPK